MQSPLLTIVNADDLGMDQVTNELVFELMAKGFVTSATLMANFPACQEAVSRISEFPHCSFGAHLNLTSGSPLYRTKALAPLLDDRGRFGGLDVLLKIKKKVSLLRAIYQELAAQVERLQTLGVQISHFDSHQHVMDIPQLFPVLKRLQITYGVRCVRISKNLYRQDDVNILRDFKKRVYNFCIRKVVSTRTTDYFTGFETFVDVASLRALPGQSIELMVHLRRQEEGWSDYVMLQMDWIDRLVRPVDLISYSQLH